jgi:protein phosphatase
MKCSNCGFENAPGAAYCEECGASLQPGQPEVFPSAPPAEGFLPEDRYRPLRVLSEGASRLFKVASVPDGKIFWAEEMPSRNPGEWEGLLEILKKLEDKHLWKVEELVNGAGRDYLVGEALEGQSLESISAASSDPGGEKVRQWGIEAAEALAALHGAGLLHRDVQPAHLFITSGGALKLRGFHRLCLMDRPPAEHLVTRSFSAPEFYGMYGGVPDERSDIFSLGAVLYTLLAGSSFQLESRESFFVFPPLSESGKETEPALEETLQKAVSKDPARRFAKASDLGSALGAIAGLFSFETEKPVYCDYAVKTDRGKVRPINQDAALALEFTCYERSRSASARLFIVADGMGGEAAGEKASSIGVRSVARRVLESYLPDESGRATRKLFPLPPREKAAAVLREAIEEANRLVHAFSLSEPQLRGMGSTITAALLIGSSLCIGHCGDTRALLIGKSYEQVSEDHSLVGQMVRLGQMNREESLKSSQRSVIYRALGSSPSIEVDIYHRELGPGEHLLLMSDGVWEYLNEEELLRLVREQEVPEKIVMECIRLCLERGADDNCTVLAVRRDPQG